MKIQAVIDRFEGKKAVLVFESEETVNWPKAMLPSEAAVGQVISIQLNIDYDETEKLQQEIDELFNKVKG